MRRGPDAPKRSNHPKMAIIERQQFEPPPFADPQAVARYAAGPPRIVPRFAHLQPMNTLLLAERGGSRTLLAPGRHKYPAYLTERQGRGE